MAPALLLAVVAISFAAIFFRLASPTHPLVAAGLRLLIAAALLAPAAARAWGDADGRAALQAGVGAGVFYGLHFGAWVTSLSLTSVAASVTLVTATPLLLAAVGLATGRDRPTPRLLAAIGLGAVGLAVLSGADLLAGGGALVGDALALFGAAAMAGYLLRARALGAALRVLPFSFSATAVGATGLLGAAALLGVPLRPASPEAAAAIVLCALVPQLVGHTLLTWALRHAPPALVGMSTVGEPVGSTLLAVLVLGETAGPAVLAGCAVTAAGVGLAFRGGAAPPADRGPPPPGAG